MSGVLASTGCGMFTIHEWGRVLGNIKTKVGNKGPLSFFSDLGK